MHKHFIVTLLILITLLTITPSVSAASQQPQAPTYQGIWQKMLLRDLLRKKVSGTPTITPTPTKKITPTPTIKAVTPAPITKPGMPTATPKTTKTPTPATTTAPTTDVTSYIMKEINDYRSSKGLSTVQTSKETCDFAKTRAQEISSNFNHDGFTKRRDSKTIPYASWSSITENIAMTSNYKDVVTMWKNSSGHAANMRSDTPFVCVMQHGNYFAYEGMKP